MMEEAKILLEIEVKHVLYIVAISLSQYQV